MKVRERVLSAIDWDVREIDAGAWGKLTIRSISALEKLKLAEEVGDRNLTNQEAAEFYCKLIALCVVEEDGKQAFSRDDVQSLLAKNWNRIEQVSNAILEFNGMAPGSVEGTAKN